MRLIRMPLDSQPDIMFLSNLDTKKQRMYGLLVGYIYTSGQMTRQEENKYA